MLGNSCAGTGRPWQCPWPEKRWAGRRNAMSDESFMYAVRESDNCIVCAEQRVVQEG